MLDDFYNHTWLWFKIITPKWMVFLLNMIIELWVIGAIILSQTHIPVPHYQSIPDLRNADGATAIAVNSVEDLSERLTPELAEPRVSQCRIPG